jgi:hypothetical protein
MARIRIINPKLLLGCDDVPDDKMLWALQNLEVKANVQAEAKDQYNLFEMPTKYTVEVKEVLNAVCESGTSLDLGLEPWEYWRAWYRIRRIRLLQIPRRAAVFIGE